MATEKQPRPDSEFQTTRWSVVRLAGGSGGAESEVALDHLCRISWYPIYAFVRREGRSEDEAKDLTQAFFERLLSTEMLSKATPERGRFRTFLLGALRNFLKDEWKKQSRRKRGGDYRFVSLDLTDAEGLYLHEPTHRESPDQLFDRRWAAALLERVREELEAEFDRAGETRRYESLKDCLEGGGRPYSELAAELGISEGAVKTAVRRFRLRFQFLLNREVAALVADSEEVEDELRHIVDVLAASGKGVHFLGNL